MIDSEKFAKSRRHLLNPISHNQAVQGISFKHIYMYDNSNSFSPANEHFHVLYAMGRVLQNTRVL
jgi:hypothetical protein